MIADSVIGEFRFSEDPRFLIDAAGSTSSNYNGACRARSKKEFIAKIGLCVEEASESLEWLLSLKDANIGSPQERDELIDEADQLTAIFTASQKTARRGNT